MHFNIQNAFHRAVSKNDLETTCRMIAAGADVGSRGENMQQHVLSLPTLALSTAYITMVTRQNNKIYTKKIATFGFPAQMQYGTMRASSFFGVDSSAS